MRSRIGIIVLNPNVRSNNFNNSINDNITGIRIYELY